MSYNQANIAILVTFGILAALLFSNFGKGGHRGGGRGEEGVYTERSMSPCPTGRNRGRSRSQYEDAGYGEGEE